MEQSINIPAKTWTDLRLLSRFRESIPFRTYNDNDQIIRISTSWVKPTVRDAGIPTYVKHFTPISAGVNAWAYTHKATTLIIQWDFDTIQVPTVQLSGAEVNILSNKLDQLIDLQKGTLLLLEAAFEDSLSGRALENGEL